MVTHDRLHSKINAIGEIMEENVHLLTNRYESMETLQDRSETLKNQSKNFERQAIQTLSWRDRFCRFVRRAFNFRTTSRD